MTTFGLPYARALDDGGCECPVPGCGQIFRDVDETQETAEDAVTKGSSRRYAEHYVAQHEQDGR